MSRMGPIFRPKHQKIILQCYPSTNLPLAETLPNAAELSSLIYYASTRRTKLDKVGTFLTKKTVSDVAHKRLGHLIVTLHILDQLLINCPDDVGVLSSYVLPILQNVTNLMELSSHLAALDVFITYCKIVQDDQNQAFGDANILSKFLKLTTHFYQCNGLQNNNNSDWIIIPVKTARAVSDYIDSAISNYYASKTKSQGLIGMGITVLLHTINKSALDLSLGKVASETSVKETVTKTTVAEEALKTLKSFFNTSSKSQMDAANTAVISFALKNNLDLRWVCHLFTITTKKSHIELRYRVIGLLLLLIDGTQSLDVSTNAQASQYYLASIISYLLSMEDIQFFAVPVKDVTTKLITLESSLVSEPATEFTSDLSYCYAEIIKSLAHRVYYNSQINDMLHQITEVHAHFTSNNPITEGSSMSQYNTFTDAVINNISDVLNIRQEPSIKVKMNPIPSDIFKRTLYALDSTLEQMMDSKTNDESYAFVSTVVINWLALFDSFYSQFSEPDWRVIDHDMFTIDTTENTVCFYIDLITKAFSVLNEHKDEKAAKQIVKTTNAYIKAIGGNFLINWWKYGKLWLANDDSLYFTSLLILKYSGYASLVQLASKHLSNTIQPLWASEFFDAQSDPSDVAKLTFEEVTEVMKSIPELEFVLSTMNGDGSVTNANNLMNMLSLPIIDFGRADVPYPNILSEANSVRSWKVADFNSGSQSSRRKSSSTQKNNGSTVSSVLLDPRYRSSSARSHLSNGMVSHIMTPSSRVGSGSTLDGLDLLAPCSAESGASITSSARAGSRRGYEAVKINLTDLRQTTMSDNQRPNSASEVQAKRSGLAYCLTNLNLSDDDDL